MSDNDTNADGNLLELLTRYTGSWSELLQKSGISDTHSILNAITAEHDLALRHILEKVNSEIHHQTAKASAQTFVSPDSKFGTDPLLGVSIPPGHRESESEDDSFSPTLIGDSLAIKATRLGLSDAGGSAHETTWSMLRAQDGSGIPSAVGNYDIHSELGRGGMGVVYRARQRGLKRDVALKMILSGAHADLALLSRFRAEAEAVARLQHPNIVQIYDIGEQDGLPYFSLEFIDGVTLDQFRKSEPVEQCRAAELIETIARAMHFAHEAGIVHRDLKPANILLTKDGVPKVTDFGLVKRIDGEDLASQTQSGSIMGTPHYMAPEQAWGKTDVSRPADIWALGAMLYALLTGRPPFSGANAMDTLVLLRESDPVAPSELVPKLSPDLETICLKCLQKEPEKRYESAESLADDIRRHLDGVPILARPVSRTERGWRWCRRNPVIAGLTAAVVVVMIVGTTVSALFGISATKSARAADIARTDADERRVYAEQKEKEADDNAERALQQRTVALSAFNTAIERAGTDLKNVPGTEEFRKQFFTAALEGLNRLSEISGNDRRDFALARGYSKAGEGFLEVGQVKEAKAQFETAHEILQRLAESESEDSAVTHFVRLGRSFRNMGRAEMALNGPATAVEWHQKALDSRRKALPLHEDPLFVKQELAESYGDLGAAYLALGQPETATEMLMHGAEYRDEWLEKAPDNDQAIQDQAGLRRQIGMVRLGLGDIEGAIQNLTMAVERLKPFASRESAGSRDYLNLGLFRSDLADALLLKGRNADAAQEYENAIGSIERVREKNPTYVPAMKFHAGALYGLAVAQGRMENSAAKSHLAKCIQLRRELAKGAASNKEFQRELMLALARSGETEEALKIADDQKTELSDDAGILYQVACAYSLASRGKDGDESSDLALKTLQEAVDKGFKSFALMAVDPDLEPLRHRDDFQSLIHQASGDTSEKVGGRDAAPSPRSDME